LNDDTLWCETDPMLSETALHGIEESGTIENDEIGMRLRLMF
jgi:hypothetical protein